MCNNNLKASAIALIGLMGGSFQLAASQKPNIIFVFADDLGYHDLGCYGQTEIKTPNIDRMAKEGIRFTNFYVASPVCAPSRCNLMTGKHAGHAEVRHNANQMPHGQIPIPDSEFTIPEMLKQVGYTTGCFGKWSLGAPGNEGDPQKQGFDQFFGYYCQCLAHNYFPDILWHNRDTIRLRNEIVPVKVNFIDYPLAYASKKVDYSAYIIFDEAVKFIENNKANPFFLYYATTLPHTNGEALPDEKYEIPDYGIYSKNDWSKLDKGYAAMVTLLDKQMGILFEKLKTLGIEKNTIVLFTSDNGGANGSTIFNSNQPFRGRKSTLYEGGIREPMIAWWPSKIPANIVSDMPWISYDLMPTFAAIASAKNPKTSDGRSVLPSLLNKKQKDANFLYWEYYSGDRNPMQAIRQGDWKLIRYEFTSPQKRDVELYNLKTDVSESNNIAAEQPQLVEKLSTIMDKQSTPYKHQGAVK